MSWLQVLNEGAFTAVVCMSVVFFVLFALWGLVSFMALLIKFTAKPAKLAGDKER